MGWFDEIKTYVSSANMLLIEETPDVIRQSVMGSIVNGTDIATDLNNTMLNIFARKADKYYEYGRDHYYLGLPNGDIGREVPKYDEVNKILNQLFPQPEGYELRLATANIERLQWDFLGEMFVYNGGLPNWEGTITDQEWVKTESHQEVEYFLSFNSSEWRPGYAGKKHRYVKARYSTQTRGKFIYERWDDFPDERPGVWEWNEEHFYPGFDMIDSPNELYYHVMYNQVRISDGAKMWSLDKGWMYRINSHIHPELDLDAGVKVTQYLPIVPLRVNNKDLMVPNDSAQYLTSKKILNYVGVDIKELRNGINKNPDIAEIDHAYFTFGIGMKNREQWALKYMFWWFLDMGLKQSITRKELEEWKQSKITEAAPYNLLTIEDGTYKMRYFWYYVYRTEHRGTIGKVGHTTINVSGDKGEFDKYSYRPNSSSDRRDWTQRSIYDKIYMSQQVAENRYDTIEICGFTQWNEIYKGDQSIGTTVANDEEVFLPVNYDFLQELKLIDKNSFYYASMRVLINAYEEVKLEWYQTGFFSWVTKVIAIAITIWSAGTLSGPVATLTGLASAGVVGVGIALAEAIVMNIIISVSFQFVAEQLGLETALILTAIVSFAAIGASFMPNIPDVSSILNSVSTAMLNAANEFVGSLITEFQEATIEMTEAYEEQMTQIDEVNKELESSTLIDPVALYAQVGMSPLDTPSTYFQRKLLTNPGLLAIEAVNNFVDNSLQLPTKQF